MTEHVGRIPLIRRRRKRPRKPTGEEVVGLVGVVLCAFSLYVLVRLPIVGHYEDSKHTPFGQGHGGFGSVPLEMAVFAVGCLLQVIGITVSVWLAWDWLKDPWEDVDD